MENCCAGVSVWPPLGVWRYAVGARPPLGPARPLCAGTIRTMQWTAPARLMIGWQLTAIAVLPAGSADWNVARAAALEEAGPPEAVYDGTSSTLFTNTVLVNV